MPLGTILVIILIILLLGSFSGYGYGFGHGGIGRVSTPSHGGFKLSPQTDHGR
jgi:hypothetical protein